MKVAGFQVQGKVNRGGVFGRSSRIFETAKVSILDGSIFSEVTEIEGDRILRKDGELYRALDEQIERIGNHNIFVSSVKDSNEILVEYLVGYEF